MVRFFRGQILVHPYHGPVTVVEVSDRLIDGCPVGFLELQTLSKDLIISLPADNVEAVGLRAVVSEERVQELLDILREPGDTQPMQWSRRIKGYDERLKSGRLEDACYVIREISRRGPKSAASMEGQLFRSAREHLAQEICLSLGLPEVDAHALIDSALQNIPKPTLATAQ